MRRDVLAALFALALLSPEVAGAQPAPPPQLAPPAESLTFDAAVQRALEKNPTVAIAAQGILRAEALLQQASTVFRPTLGGTVVMTTLDSARGFDDLVTQPRTQVVSDATLAYPVLSAARWAARTQAADQVAISRISLEETRRQIAIATAQSYLAIIAAERQVDANTAARDNAKAHVDYAQTRLDAGAGSRLNLLRAQQELAADAVLVEVARLAVARAQEALGVLVAADAPIDAAGEPAFDRPPALPATTDWLTGRSDIRLATAEVAAADRVFRDSWRDWVPTANAGFAPQLVTPSGLFQPSRTWRGFVSMTVPVLDGGSRRATKRERGVAVDTAKSQLTDLELRAKSELRTAQAAVEHTERALAYAQSSSQNAAEVLKITDVAFREGATTNIELIDAQRRARDSDITAALAEDRVRQSRLDLLVALGQFPK